MLTYWETHADSEALIFHADRFANGDYIGQVLERTEGATLCFYGEVSQQMKHWAAENGFEVEYAELVDGFQRQRSLPSPDMRCASKLSTRSNLDQWTQYNRKWKKSVLEERDAPVVVSIQIIAW